MIPGCDSTVVSCKLWSFCGGRRADTVSALLVEWYLEFNHQPCRARRKWGNWPNEQLGIKFVVGSSESRPVPSVDVVEPSSLIEMAVGLVCLSLLFFHRNSTYCSLLPT